MDCTLGKSIWVRTLSFLDIDLFFLKKKIVYWVEILLKFVRIEWQPQLDIIQRMDYPINI